MSWARIVGHPHLIDSFRDIVRRGRLAHAYLFVGRDGVGKNAFAHELAKALLCEKANADLEACDACAACRLMDAGTHPDFFAVRRPEEKNVVPIGVMRELCANFGLKTARGKGKVAILVDADDLEAEAANCFLKTLEEPPPRSTFILIGSSPDLQLATIRSRSQVVRFAPLSDAEVDEVLRRNGVEEAALRRRLVRAGQGSPGQALALAEAELWEFRRRFILDFTKPRPDGAKLAKALIQTVEDAGKEASVQRKKAGVLLDLLVSAWTDALRRAVGEAARGAESDELAALEALARRAGPEKLMDLLERWLEAEKQIGFYLQIGLVLEGVVEASIRILEENPTSAPVSAGK
ncbi:MAG: DNA polymerase III subunit delta' [Gemmataceae bacterium]